MLQKHYAAIVGSASTEAADIIEATFNDMMTVGQPSEYDPGRSTLVKRRTWSKLGIGANRAGSPVIHIPSTFLPHQSSLSARIDVEKLGHQCDDGRIKFEGDNDMDAQSEPSLGNLAAGNTQEEYICWSRMQAEAGQSLDEIISRKELERLAGRGSFFWGVGNAPAVIAKFLARTHVPVSVVFSIMKSRPKAIDTKPVRTLVWRRYIDADGADQPLPAHTLVTSRGDSARGAKRSHYALMCRSNTPLVLRFGSVFDPTAYRNAGGKGAPVGASQVTALLRRVGQNDSTSGYEKNLTAWLTGSYWVRLLDPLELNRARRNLLESLAGSTLDDWCAIVQELRRGPRPDNYEIPEGALL